PAPTTTYPLSLHDALPICQHRVPTAPVRVDKAGQVLSPPIAGEVPFGHQHRERAAAQVSGLLGQDQPLEQARLGHGPSHADPRRDRKSTRLNSSHVSISYA